MGNLKLVKYIFQGFVAIIGGYAAHRYGLVTNYWLSLIQTPIAIFICLTIYEPQKCRGVNGKEETINFIHSI